MLVSEFVPAVALRATGKYPTYVTGSIKWNKIIGIANHNIRSWATEPGVDWNSLYIPNQVLGPVTATDTYTLLPANIIKVSKREGDYVRINHTDGVNYTDFDLVEADALKGTYWGQTKRNYSGFYVAQVGNTLVFNRSFTASDPQFGGSITVPVYKYPTPISADTDVIPVDLPNWLVCMTAADYVMNDITRVSSYPTLVNQANELMTAMRDNNEAQIEMLIRPWRAPGGMGGHGYSNSAGMPLGQD